MAGGHGKLDAIFVVGVLFNDCGFHSGFRIHALDNYGVCQRCFGQEEGVRFVVPSDDCRLDDTGERPHGAK